MNASTLMKLEFFKVREILTTFAITYLGRQRISELMPMTNLKMIQNHLLEAAEAKHLLDRSSFVPLPSLEGMELAASHLEKGFILTEQELGAFAQFLRSCAHLKQFLLRKEETAPVVAAYAKSFFDLSQVLVEIERCIYNGQITDNASAELTKIRKKLHTTEERIKKRLEAIMQKHRSKLQENLVSMRSNRFVIPVKKEYRKLIPGHVWDESSSGQTVYMEPGEISPLQQELNLLQMEEASEEQKVLGSLTELLDEYRYEIRINLETVGHFDFILAKAKYAKSLDGRNVSLNDQGIIDIKEGRHPLLEGRKVPLNFSIGEGFKALMITGPNTGGKTVALKTVGLLTLMVQSGLLAPVQEGSRFAVFQNIEADIGDGQSIEQSLSTFSSHIRNIVSILEMADRQTLVMLDELGTGTDPGEGVGLSIAVLEELYRRQSTIVATTHYNEIKAFARSASGFENARMEFDLSTLQPLYRLSVGEAGDSYAFVIARKLGMAPSIIERSEEITRNIGSSRLEGMVINAPFTREGSASASNPVISQAEVDAGRTEKRPQEARAIFQVGDCVFVKYLNRKGIVCEPENDFGEVVVLIQKQKVKIKAKRLSLFIEKKELYPDNYDMDIVFESKDVRKKRKLMSRKHVAGLQIIHRPEDGSGK